MRKIDFDTLHDLVCFIDYIDDDSYPIVFEVHNKNERPIRYVCGLTSIEDSLKEGDRELYDLICESIGTDCEIQFLYNEYSLEFLDLQDCDDMDCYEIETMLKKKAKINEDSVIFLDEEESFNHAACGWLGCELDEDGNIECKCLLSDDLIEELRRKLIKEKMKERE